jgi:hypothetical protein
MDGQSARPSIPSPRISLVRIALAGALLAVSLLIAWLALRMLLAGWFSQQAQEFLEDWAALDAEPSAVAFAVAEQAALKAVSLYPVPSGAYLDRLGRVYQWRHHRQPATSTDPEVVASRRAAIHAYEAAIAARPLWPYTWARVALAKLSLAETDASFAEALRRAHELGPWRAGINQRVSQMGLQTWRALDADTRRLVLESATRRAASSAANAREVLRLAESVGQKGAVCAALSAVAKRKYGVCL